MNKEEAKKRLKEIKQEQKRLQAIINKPDRMKTAKQWSEEWSKDPEVTFEEIIEQAQKEAYNQAIDDAVMNAEAKVKVWYDFGTGYYQRGDVIVDRNSILKLKK